MILLVGLVAYPTWALELRLLPRRRPADVAERAAKDRARVLPKGELPPDGRLDPYRTTRDPYHPWSPPADLAAWERRAARLKTQLLVANGLWPMPERTPLEPVIHGKIDKGDYTIEKVYFQSVPGHYVTGNLYRPAGRTGKLPAILAPHGHWNNGRLHDAGEQEAAKQLDQRGEQFTLNARYPLQALMAAIARMGCVGFQYDMVGYADSKSITHGAGFNDAQAMLRLQSAMGLQTWNSIRALDFLCSIEDVDTSRIGVTGASGGGTQTFILGALDDRPAVTFPAVMVSADMQGGCVCENCPILRVGTTNVEFAALFAPRPLGMSAANDWTRDIETKGLPELKRLYSLFRAEDAVMARTFLQFGHNYNQVSREVMAEWMNRWLALGLADTKERPIDAVPPAELSVFDAEHPLPADAKAPVELRRYWDELWERSFAALEPRDPRRWKNFSETVRPALATMVTDEFPSAPDLIVQDLGDVTPSDFTVHRLLLGRRQPELLLPREAIPTAVYMPGAWNGRMVVWVDAEGHANLVDAATGLPGQKLQGLLDQGYAVLAPDVYLAGEFNPDDRYTLPRGVDLIYGGYTFCYNRTPFANRVHDILTAVGCAEHLFGARSIDLVGFGAAGPWVLLARALAGDHVRRAVADCHRFSFHSVKLASDLMFLPGGLKYGDLIGLARLCAPGELYLLGLDTYSYSEVMGVARAYESAGNPDGLVLEKFPDTDQSVPLTWLVR